MKKIIPIIFMMCFIPNAYAQTKEENCKLLGIMGYTAQYQRQSDHDQAEITKRLLCNIKVVYSNEPEDVQKKAYQFSEATIKEAYKYQVFKDIEQKRKAVRDFENITYTKCMKTLDLSN